MGLEPMGYTAANRRTIKLMVEQAAPLFEDGSAPMFMNMATAVIEVTVGKLFYAIAPIGDPNAGKKRLFLRVNSAPYYEDQGDAAAPGSQAQIDAAAALNQAAVEAVETRQDDVEAALGAVAARQDNVEAALSGALSSSSYRPTPADGADLPVDSYFLSPNAGDGGTVWVYKRVAEAPGYTAIQRQEVSADQIADGETKVSMTVGERVAIPAARLTSGDLPLTNSVSQAFNGGVLMAAPDVGFTIPDGSSGLNTFVMPRIALDTAQRAALTGRTIRLRAIATVSADFLAQKPLQVSPVTAYLAAGGTRSGQGVLARSEQIGTVLYRECTYVVQGDESSLGVPLQVNTNASAGAWSLQVTKLGYTLEVLPEGALATAADEQLALRLADFWAAKGADEQFDQLDGQVGAINSALAVAPEPAGSIAQVARYNTGAGFRLFASFLDVGEGADKLVAGRRYRDISLFLQAGAGAVNIMFDLVKRSLGSASLNAAPGAAGDIYLQKDVAIPLATLGLTAGDSVSRTCSIPVDFVAEAGFTYAWQVRAHDSGGARVLVGMGNNGAYDAGQTIRTRGYFSTATTGGGIVPGNVAGLASTWYADALFSAADNQSEMDAIRAQVAAVAAGVARAWGIDLGQYQRVVTVKTSGGDYAHPKLALDAITDASATNRVAIAIYPGTYTGYAEWHTKDYVDLIGIGRREEITVSYANPTNASSSTIVNTSLLWLDSRSNIAGLTLAITGGRYAIHRETNGIKPNNMSRMINCKAEHLGHAGYDNGSAWLNNEVALGCGLSAGEIYQDRGCIFRGPDGGMAYHTPNAGLVGGRYDNPTFVDMEGCSFVATRTDTRRHDLMITVISPGGGDICRLVGNDIGLLRYTDLNWLDPADVTTNRAQIRIIGHANTAMEWWNQMPAGRGDDYRPEFTGFGGAVTDYVP